PHPHVGVVDGSHARAAAGRAQCRGPRQGVRARRGRAGDAEGRRSDLATATTAPGSGSAREDNAFVLLVGRLGYLLGGAVVMRTTVELAAAFALGIFTVPVAGDAQQATKLWRVGPSRDRLRDHG